MSLSIVTQNYPDVFRKLHNVAVPHQVFSPCAPQAVSSDFHIHRQGFVTRLKWAARTVCSPRVYRAQTIRLRIGIRKEPSLRLKIGTQTRPVWVGAVDWGLLGGPPV